MNKSVLSFLCCLIASSVPLPSPVIAQPTEGGGRSVTSRVVEAMGSKTPMAVVKTSGGYQITIGSEAVDGDATALLEYLQGLLHQYPSDKAFASAVEDFALEQNSPSANVAILLRTARANQMGLSLKILARQPSLEKFVVANGIHRSMALFGHSVSFHRNGSPMLLLNGQPTEWKVIDETIAVDREGRMMGFAYTSDGFVGVDKAPLKSEELTGVILSPPVVPESVPTFSTASQKSPLESAHYALFEFFNPDSAHLDEQAQTLRKGIEVQSFLAISQNAQLQQLIAPLMAPGIIPNEIAHHYPEFLKGGIAALDIKQRENLLMELRRSPDNRWRSYVWQLRKAYLWMAYPPVYANHLAQIQQKPSPVREAPFELPESQLRLENNEITHVDGEIDYLIIGSGPAGSLIANELARQKGLRIVVIEAGSFVKPGTIKTESMSELMESQNQRTNTAGGIAFRNGYAVGGGTTVNLDLAFPLHLKGIRSHLRSWVISNPSLREKLENPDSAIEDTELAEEDDFADLRGTLYDAYDEVERRLGTRRVEESEINANNRLLFDHIAPAAKANTYKLNQKPISDSNENGKISAVDVFLIPALMGGDGIESRISIVPDVKTLRVQTQRQKGKLTATGVEVEFQKPWNETFIVQDPNGFQAAPGTRATIRAKNVIVSAGTLGSAEILLRSDLNNDQIGRGIVIHPSYGMPSLFGNEVNAHEGLPTSVYAEGPLEEGFYYEAMSADPNFLALIHPGSGEQIQQSLKDYRRIGGFGIMLIDTPNPNNRVALNKDTGAVEVQYTLNPEDIVRLKVALKKALHGLFRAGAQQILLSSSEPLLSNELEYEALTQDDQVDSAVDRMSFAENLNFISSAHMQGSNKMGSDPTASVLSPNLRVWDTKSGREIENFYVMDSSIFPTSVGANPMQSIYTLAKLFTDYVLLADVQTAPSDRVQSKQTFEVVENPKPSVVEEKDTTESKSLSLSTYEAYFSVCKAIVEKWGAPGAVAGMFLTETPALIKGGYYTHVKYNKEPEIYGFNQVKEEHRDKRPVLLFHGAVGSWNYLYDMAAAIRDSGRPTFVMSLGGGDATEEKRRSVLQQMERIQGLYQQQFGRPPAAIDFVAHSMGANLALYSTFAADGTSIDETGLRFIPNTVPTANTRVGRVITVANPTNAQEVSWLQQIGKADNVYNVIAKYDVLMGHKPPALTAAQRTEVNAAHIGIVSQEDAHSQVLHFLDRRSE